MDRYPQNGNDLLIGVIVGRMSVYTEAKCKERCTICPIHGNHNYGLYRWKLKTLRICSKDRGVI